MKFNNSLLFLSGIVLALAYDDLSSKKVAMQTSTVPGPYDWYKADNAVDRNITTCMRTKDLSETAPHTAWLTGQIGTHPQYPDHTGWWKVDLGGIFSIYSVNILFKNYMYDENESRQRGRFAGFSIYVSITGDIDHSSLCYKNGPELPSLNFTVICITFGRYVIYYNERVTGVTYPDGYQLVNVFTELCEVTVLGCRSPMVYGSNCDVLCPVNCIYNTCHIQNGTCFECKPGWTGTKCYKACLRGLYGQDCKKQCSGHCKDNVPCNHVTGQCDRGCAAGWMDDLCDKGCENGTFGENCLYNCSSYCLNDSPCNKQTGSCEGGCKPGYTNALCNEHCIPGYFGNECEEVCSAHCLNNTNCDPINGTCIGGCEDGYIGKQCNTSCKEGYYGQECSQVCSLNCETCIPTNGTCNSCIAGWMGPNCSIGCVWSYGVDCQFPCNSCFNQTCNRVNGSCLSGCVDGFHGQKCDQEHASTNQWDRYSSTLSYVIIGATVSVCLFITSLVIVIRRKRLSLPKTKISPYAEIGNHQSGDLKYQELTVTELNKTYQNLMLH